jgi:hypothetical protein
MLLGRTGTLAARARAVAGRHTPAGNGSPASTS